MKISEMRPCISCDGPLIGPGKGPMFYVLRYSLAMADQKNYSGVAGVMQIVGGGKESLAALNIAEAMAPRADDAFIIAGDKEPELWTKVFLCQPCFMESPLAIWQEAQGVRDQKEEETRNGKHGEGGGDRSSD